MYIFIEGLQDSEEHLPVFFKICSEFRSFLLFTKTVRAGNLRLLVGIFLPLCPQTSDNTVVTAARSNATDANMIPLLPHGVRVRLPVSLSVFVNSKNQEPANAVPTASKVDKYFRININVSIVKWLPHTEYARITNIGYLC